MKRAGVHTGVKLQKIPDGAMQEVVAVFSVRCICAYLACDRTGIQIMR
jgi:hypothetical protein